MVAQKLAPNTKEPDPHVSGALGLGEASRGWKKSTEEPHKW